MIKSQNKLSMKQYYPMQSHWIGRDLKHIWHPCSQMHDFEAASPLLVTGAQGAYLHTPEGPIIDAISSWWCKPLGHQHPNIIKAIETQLHTFEHIISANTTHKNSVLLAEKLAELSRLPYAFFASDGSSAVEIALKLSIHAKQLENQPQRTQFLALQNSYHGETLGTLSVSDLGLYNEPYQQYALPCHFIKPLPYTSGLDDPLSLNAQEAWDTILPELESIKDKLCAFIFEPIIQGAGGMRSYSADFLYRLYNWAKQNQIYCIADEIMTGFCRTGAWFACEHAKLQPDLICISKGLTGGALPLSAVLVSQSIYDLFYHPYESGQNFLHSHTHSGNALAIAAALATLQTLEKESINEQAIKLQTRMRQAFEALQTQTGVLSNIRGIGGIIAADLKPNGNSRLGYQLQLEALKHSILLRPLGNTLYWLPPLNLSQQTLEELTEKTYQTLRSVYQLTQDVCYENS